MPNRGELAVRAERCGSGASAGADAWLIIGLCAIGLLVTVFFAAYSRPFEQIPVLVAEYNLG